MPVATQAGGHSWEEGESEWKERVLIDVHVFCFGEYHRKHDPEHKARVPPRAYASVRP